MAGHEYQQEHVRIGQVHLGLVLPAELEAEQDECSKERARDETTKKRVSAARVLGAAADPAEQGEHDADQVEGRRESEGQPTEQPEHGREHGHLEEPPRRRHLAPLRDHVPHGTTSPVLIRSGPYWPCSHSPFISLISLSLEGWASVNPYRCVERRRRPLRHPSSVPAESASHCQPARQDSNL